MVIGGGFPISVQTMCKEPLGGEEAALVKMAKRLEALGCELLRFAIPDEQTADRLGQLAARLELPLVADIHFDHTLALRCLDYPIAKIRINPGTIGAAWKAEEVIRKASDTQIALRIGINSGSLPGNLRHEKDTVAAMVKAAEKELEILDRLSFKNVIFSLKSPEVETTVQANLLFSGRYDYPLHLGVTEAGPLIPGVVKNTLGITELLKKGVGDTIRVSLSDSAENEIITGRSILENTGFRAVSAQIVSCPRCGRAAFDVKTFLDNVSQNILSLSKTVTVAIMGCVVNGPGEARHADLGISGSKSGAILFKHGKVIRHVPVEEALNVFKEELKRL